MGLESRAKRILVVGGGSIGMRHLRNLRQLGVEDLALVEPVAGRQATTATEIDCPVFTTLDKAIPWSPTAGVVATPTSLHLQPAMTLARAGCDLFIEKPLAHTMAGVAEILDKCAQLKLVSMVGCNMRFHPGPKRIKSLIDEGTIGRVLSARIHTGSYMPDWRPAIDYRTVYSARLDLGGGCVLDCIHEIDLACWYIGNVTDVAAMLGKVSDMDIDVEDVASILLRHESGTVTEVHLDYVQRTLERGCQIVGELGSLFWDYRQGSVTIVKPSPATTQVEAQPKHWEPNRMYVDEMAHWLRCIEGRTNTGNDVRSAANVLAIAIAAKKSSLDRQFIAPERIIG